MSASFFKVPEFFSHRMHGNRIKTAVSADISSHKLKYSYRQGLKYTWLVTCIFLIIVSGHVYCFIRSMNDCSLNNCSFTWFSCLLVPCTTVFFPARGFFHLRLPPYDALSPLPIILYFFVRYFDVNSAFFCFTLFYFVSSAIFSVGVS